MKTVWQSPAAESPSGFAIALEQYETQAGRAGRFRVTYGKQIKTHLPYGKAALELGAALMHRAACDGLLDNEGDDDDR